MSKARLKVFARTPNWQSHVAMRRKALTISTVWAVCYVTLYVSLSLNGAYIMKYSSVAIQIHVGKSKHWMDRHPLKYMSYSRSLELYELQMELMKKLNIPVVDAFQTSYLSAEHMPPGDARHYLKIMYQKVLMAYYPTNS